ncbi:MAG: hypothetical protein HYW63_02235 [Candidatus Levybacteria bacterium]|nr:hypothetical protein [Candidatus Levybacteria bacterium]
MPIEAPQSRPRYDALLAHGYWMSEHRTGLGLRSRLSTRAAAVELNQRETKTVFVNLDRLWGPTEPSEGELIAKELEEHYHIPHEDIVLRQDAWSTGGEVKTFVEEAKQHGWTNLLDVAFSKHHSLISILGRRFGTIPLIYKGLGLKPQYKSVEDILREKDIHRINRRYKVRKVLDVDKDGNPKPWKQVPIAERQYAETGEERPFVHEHNHTAKLVNKLTGLKSKFEAIYFLYEGIKWTLMHRPGFNYEALEQANRNSRKEKGTDSPLSRRLGRLFDFDVYTLNGKRSPFSYKKEGKSCIIFP